MNEMYRHGDLLFVRTDEGELPPDAELQGSDVVAWGEATGHAHRARGGQVLRVRDAPRNGHDTYVRFLTPGRLTHEEHHTIDVPPGLYRVLRQREYSPPRRTQPAPQTQREEPDWRAIAD